MHKPLWFEKAIDADTGMETLKFNGKYWECKEKNDWSMCPDIYWAVPDHLRCILCRFFASFVCITVSCLVIISTCWFQTTQTAYSNIEYEKRYKNRLDVNVIKVFGNLKLLPKVGLVQSEPVLNPADDLKNIVCGIGIKVLKMSSYLSIYWRNRLLSQTEFSIL